MVVPLELAAESAKPPNEAEACGDADALDLAEAEDTNADALSLRDADGLADELDAAADEADGDAALAADEEAAAAETLEAGEAEDDAAAAADDEEADRAAVFCA